MATTTIKLINGGEIIPIDLAPFSNPAWRIDPLALPDLPAGVTLDDLRHTLDAMTCADNVDDAVLLEREIKVRTLGYLPAYATDGYDQYNYNREGLDPEGRDRYGLSAEDREKDPMLSDVPRLPGYAKGTEEPDQRAKSKGNPRNRGNKNGRAALSTDGTLRTLNKCWHDLLLANEVIPVQDRLTDEELTSKLSAMFSGREHRVSARKMRWNFNKGVLPCQGGMLPLLTSYRYIKIGNFLRQTTARGRTLQEWDLTDLKLGQNMRPKGKA